MNEPHTEFGPESSPPLPWTQEQVDALNRYQEAGRFHPFTCGNNRFTEPHKAYQKEHGGDLGQLVATPNGWICPACDYTQDWAHAAMFRTDVQQELEQGKDAWR